MARVKYSAFISEINGSIGKGTLQKSNGVNIMREKPNSTTFASRFLNSNRIYTIKATQYWRTLTTAQKQKWSNVVKLFPLYHQNNSKVLLSPYQYFVKFNFYVQLAGFNILAEPTSSGNEELLNDIEFQLQSSQVHVIYSNENDTGNIWNLLFMSKFETKPSYKQYNRMLNVPTGSSTGDDININSAYLELFNIQPTLNQVCYAYNVVFSLTSCKLQVGTPKLITLLNP